ncbi:MAG: DUF4270 family protein [Saprospiraceae bacterium]
MKMNPLASMLALVIGLSLWITNCADPLEVGAELLAEDQANVGFTDTFTLQAHTIKGDSVRAYYPSSTGGAVLNFLFGRMVDPLFGTTSTGFYMEPLLWRDVVGSNIEFFTRQGLILDSIILVLPLDSTGYYGRIDGSFGIDVFELTEPILVDANENGALEFYSNLDFDVNPVPPGIYILYAQLQRYGIGGGIRRSFLPRQHPNQNPAYPHSFGSRFRGTLPSARYRCLSIRQYAAGIFQRALHTTHRGDRRHAGATVE